ncbi:MAG: Bcr/CflA family efflux MFS transporter [Acetobacteraceae bacterium]|nr:Bcr/CflA family efflux MFS transporter [Acetobacteraceae bacterium]
MSIAPTTASPAPEPIPYPRRLPRLLRTFIAVGPAAADMYLPAFPAVEATFHTAPGTARLTLAAWFAGLAVGQIMQGTLSDRFGRRKPLAIGGAVASSLTVLAVLRFVGAMGASAGMVIGRAVVRDLASGERGAILMSRLVLVLVLVLVMGVAPILASSVGAAFLAFADWRLICWFQAIYGVCCALLAWRILPETLPDQRRIKVGLAQVLTRYGAIPREPIFRTHAFMGGASTFCMFAYLGGSSPVFIQGFGMSPSGFGLIFGLCSCGLIAGSQINARLLPRFGLFTMPRAICRISLAATTVLLVLSFSGAHQPWMIVAPIFVALSCQGFSNGNVAAGALARHAAHAGSDAALMGVGQFALGASSGLFVGLLTDGTPRGMALLMFCGALCAVVVDLFRPRG